MEQCFVDEPVKTEPMDFDYCQDDVNISLDEPTAFVHESQPILVPEMGNGEVEQATKNDNQCAVPSKRKRGPSKKRSTVMWAKNKKKLTTAQKKLDKYKHADNHDLIESTIDSETSSYHPPTMLEEPQDVIKTEQDNPAHPSVDLPCPPTLQHYTDDEISSAFEQCGAGSGKASLKLKIADSGSLFGQVYTKLTNNKKSCLYERQYLHRLWVQKYKPESLKQFTEEQIGTAFLLCYNRKSKLNMNVPNSLFSKVCTFLTENKKSNCIERRYLFDLWTIKFKEALQCTERQRLSTVHKARREKVHRRLLRERKRNLLLEQTTITQPVGEYSSSELLETTFQTEHDDGEIQPTFPQFTEKQEEKQIRIRVKVEVEVDDDYEASDAENIEDSTVVNDPSYELASPVPLSPHISEPDNPKPQQKASEDTDPKLTLKPVVRLSRLNPKKINLEEEELSKVKGQPENTLKDRSIRKSVRNKKYTGDDDLSVNADVSDDYIASEKDKNGSDDDSEYDLKSSTSMKNKNTISSRSRNASARAMKRARGRPRIHPIRVKKPRLRKSLFEKLVNWWHWGVYKSRFTPDQLPIPIHVWQESHGKHSKFIVSNTCENLEDIEKTAPSAGKGTFANPHWTCSNSGKEDEEIGPLKCVCPACGLTFLEIDELLQHRDKNHKEYLSMCVVCSKPIDRRINMAPHLATHCTKDQMEEFLEEELATLGAPPSKGSHYRLYKCQKCHDIFVGSKRLYIHKAQCTVKLENWIPQKRVRENYVTKKQFLFKEIDGPSSGWTSNCKVCGKPLSSEYMSLHLRTHFNFEEQKGYVREQQNKLNNENNAIVGKGVPGKDRTDVRIEQLKNLLEALERKNGKVITKWAKPIIANESTVIQKERRVTSTRTVNVKRDGNYGPVQCATCGKVITTIYSLRKHEIAKHTLENNFECSICHRPFRLKTRVHLHTPTHFNLEEQEKYSVWTGSLREFLERLNSGEDLSKPPTYTPTRGRKVKLERRQIRVRKKPGRPRKHHHLYEDKDVRQKRSGSGDGSQCQIPPTDPGATETSTLAFSLTAEVPTSTFYWNTPGAQGQQGQDALEYI